MTMPMRLLRTFLVLASLASSLAFADSKADLSKKLLETTGIKTQAEQLPQLLESALKEHQQQAELTTEQFDAIAKAMRDRLAPTSFYLVLEAEFIKAVDEKALQAVNRWYQSPFAKKVTALEDKASKPEGQAEFQQFAQAMETTPPSAERVKLVQGLDEAVRGTELLLEMMVGITKGMARGALSATSGKPAEEIPDEQFEELRLQARPAFQSLTLVSLLYTYRTLGDQELTEYLKFLSTPFARAFYQAVVRGYLAAFEDASTKIGKDLAGALGAAGKSAEKLYATETGTRPAAPAVPPHPLLIATETLCQRALPESCDELMKLASMAPGLTDDDFVRLQFMAAIRSVDKGDELGARRALSQALQNDPAAQPQPFASPRLRKLFEEVRMQAPSGAVPGNKASRIAAAKKAASAREPTVQVLLRAVDALYALLQVDGAIVVNDLARASAPLTATDRARVSLRDGILKMESGDEAGARSAFREALEADRNARIPDFAPPKTFRLFEEVSHVVPAVPASASAPKQPSVKSGIPITPSDEMPLTRGTAVDDLRGWGYIAGGAGLAFVAGGAVAGSIALSAYQAQQNASTGDWTAYHHNLETYGRNRNAAKLASIVADGLYGAGAIALVTGAFLVLRAPGEVAVGAGAGQGQASLMVRGHF